MRKQDNNQWRLVVACPTKHSRNLNYITDDEDYDNEAPPSLPSKYITRSQTRNALLSVFELSNSKPTPRNSTNRKYTLKLLCYMTPAIMDANGDLLECHHLVWRPEYKGECEHQYGNKVCRLVQGMLGRTKGTNTILIHKLEAPPER